MFSSEQILEVSGAMNQLEKAIRFAMDMYGIPRHPSYQITEDGKYCLGWIVDEKEGWKPFPFDYDPHIISEIVRQHLEKHDVDDPYSEYDGSSAKGFLMKAIPQLASAVYDGIKRPFYGIVSFEVYYNYYGK